MGKPAVTVAALAVLASALLASLAMALAAGDFDPSFSGDGVFVEPLGDGPRPGGDVSALALQPDGKIVVAGGGSSSNIVIARLNPDGTLDPSFGTGGKVLTTLGTGSGDSLFPRAVAIQADGRILVGGLLSPNGGTQRPFVARLNTDGSLDGSYASGGLFASQLGADPNPYPGLQAIVLQPDGKLLLAGGAKDATGQGAVLVARLNAQGNLDGSFGNGGKATPQLGEGTSPNSGANALALQPDGKIVIAGSGTDTNNPAQPDAAVVARLDSEGKNLDPSFGSGGKVLSRLGQSAPVITTPHALALQPDGKPVVAGEAIDGSGHQHVLVSRLNADGQGLDPGFATGGTLFTTLGDGPNADSSLSALVLQPDGKIVGAGYGEGTSFVGALIARLKSDGTLDGAFANGGKILAPLGQVSAGFAAIAADPNGRLVAGGNARNNVNGNIDTHQLVARVIADLPPVASFIASPNPVDPGQPVAFAENGSTDPDGSIVSFAWSFGDGATAAAPNASHSYAAPGSYQATLTVRDDYGVAASSTQTITVRSPAPGAVAGPALSAFKIRPLRFPAAKRGGSVARKTGAVVSYRDSQAATTTFTVARSAPGRKSGKRCVKPTQRNRRAKRCTRFVALRGSFRHADKAGSTRFRFTGRLRRKALRPGRYRLSATPRAGGRKGKTVSARFTIIR